MIDPNNEWAEQQLAKLHAQATTYPTQALLRAARQLAVAQDQRLDQLRGELDGRMWSPQKW